ncbi:hypothetical protein PROFUN_08014 [Planoprotostelium fungivorum]|uniref:Uncharacterized protein n=1 Tax=Planoprotostelium fungivorum TaxID=1890364 RepID=A0A2P6MVA1_9EUKA|nr:hypothetical protein PROFUN_08014 [Planoprotostelium fungivorum]
MSDGLQRLFSFRWYHPSQLLSQAHRFVTLDIQPSSYSSHYSTINLARDRLNEDDEVP